MDTIDHSDPGGERVTIAPNASRASRRCEEQGGRRRSRRMPRLRKPAKRAASGRWRGSRRGRGQGGRQGRGKERRRRQRPPKPRQPPASSAGRRPGAPARLPRKLPSSAGNRCRDRRSGRGISGTLSAPRGGKADRLTLIKGIGPVNERKLNEHGVFHFDQIAAWTRGRYRGGGGLSGLRRAHRARRLGRTGRAPCRRARAPPRPQSARGK